MRINQDEKLPRRHAYVHMRNRGYTFHIDYREIDSEQAERIMKAISEILKSDEDCGREELEES